jgi:flagellar hook-basal body complex protein FliE
MQNNNTFDDFIDRKKEKAAKKKMENTLNAFIDEVTDEQSYTRSIEEIGVEGFDSDSISSVSTSSDEKPKKKRK